MNEKDPDVKQRYENKAVGLLREAFKAGLKVTKNPKTNPYFKSLLKRDDFIQVLKENGWDDAK